MPILLTVDSAEKEALLKGPVMGRLKMILVLLCACLACIQVRAQENSVSEGTYCIPVRTVAEDSLAYMAGEKLVYTMHYEWGAIDSDVGTGTVTLDSARFNGQKVFKCSVYGKTTRIYDLFFKVREDFSSWFTRDGLRPLKFTRDTHEGKYIAKNTYIYDWNAAEPHIIADVYSSSRGQRSLEIPLTPCTYDLPALFFYARNMDLDTVVPGKKYPMTFAIDDDVYNVYFILYGRETIKVKGVGKVRTIKFAARLLAGEVFNGEEDMLVWISDDENRIPVKFEAPILVGTASGRLKSWSGLKHPFTALIKK